MTRARENADLPVAMTESDGKVGVGMTPVVNLDIAESSSGVDAILGLTAGTGGRAQIRSEAQGDGTSSEISFHTMVGSNTSERMRIDGSGRVTMPNQPMFSVTRPTAGTALQGDIFSGQTPTQDFTMQGFTFNSSNGRFTCPVAGKYWVGFHTLHWYVGCNIYVRVNDTMKFQVYGQGGTQLWRKTGSFGILNLAGGDYLNFTQQDTAGSHNIHGTSHMRAVAYLIG